MIQLIRFNFARKFVPVSRDKLTWFIFNRIDDSALFDAVLVVLVVVIMVVLVVVVMVDFFVDLIGLVSFVGLMLYPGLKVAVSGGLSTSSMSSNSSYSSSKYELTLLWVSHLVNVLVLLRYFIWQL